MTSLSKTKLTSQELMAITETWLLPRDTDGAVIGGVTPTGYVFRHISRKRRGGGVAVLYKKSLKS